MSCVNTKSERFRQLAQKYDLSNGFLENILHEYYNDEQYSLLFPSEEAFIENRLSQGKNIVTSQEQIDLYNKFYSQLQIFDTWKQVSRYVSQAEKYFSKDAISVIETSRGTYKVIISIPELQKSTEDEIQQIREQAIKDGTFMKAPNGNPTNLINERQWLQVRTKAFIKWFGNWLGVNKFNTNAIDISRVDIEETSNPNEHQGNKTLKIYLKGQHEKGHFELVKDREFGQYSVHLKTDKSKLEKGDTKILFEELAKAIPDGAIVSTWGSLTKDGVRALNDNIGRGMTKIGEREATLKSDGSKIMIPIYQKGEGVSKVVDENGEPLVVYHSSKSENITSFRNYEETIISKNEEWIYNKGIKDWVKEGWDISKEQEVDYNNGKQITIRKPNAIYASSNYEVSKDYQRNIHNEEEPEYIGKTYPVFLNIRDVEIIDAKGKSWKKIEYNGRIHSTRSLESLFRGKKDGLIIKNVFDLNSDTLLVVEDNLGTTYIVYNPNQIKSATDNVGTFSIEDNNMYENRTKELNILKVISNAERNVIEYLSKGEVGKANGAIRRANEEIHRLYPNLDIARNLTSLRNTSSLEALKRLGNDNESLTIEEMKELTQMLANKLGVTFTFRPEGIATIKERTGSQNTVCYVEGNNGIFEIHFNKAVLPTYTQLAEELLHPLVYTIQTKNPTLFNSFLDEIGRSDDKAIAAIAKRVEKLYRDKSTDEVNNEKVTQVLSFMMQEANIKKYNNDSPIGSIFRRILEWISNLFSSTHISNIAPEHYLTLQNLAYVLKFENVIFQVDSWANGTQFSNREETADNSQLSEQQKEYIQKSSRLLQQIENLIDNEVGLTSTDIQHIAEQVVFWISDAITDYQQNPEKVFQVFKNGQKPTQEELDKVRKMSRVELVKFIGAKNLILQCKLQVFTPSTDGGIDGKNPNLNTRKLRKQAQLIFDNFEAVVQQASSIFATMENFTIDVMENYDITEDVAVNADVFNPEDSNDEDDINETKGDTQEHWQIESRTIDVINSMSQLVKRALSQCYLLQATGEVDAQGNPVVKNVLSSFGIKERVSARDATNSILRWTQGALDINQMVAMLKEKQKDNPWLSQLTDKLSDTTGQYSDLQSQFFSVFCKHFQSYSVVSRNEKGKLYCHEINEAPALREIIKGIEVQYKLGEHTLFTPEGINKQQFAELENTYNELKAMRETPLAQLDPHKVAELIGFAAANFGYYATEQDILGSLEQQEFTKMIDYLGYIMQSLRNELENRNYDPFKFDRESNPNGIKGNLSQFLRPLTEKLEDIAISSVFDSGKMYQSYVTPSFTTKLFNKIHSSDEEFTKFLQDEYGQYEWFKDPRYEENPLAGWMNAWLRDMAKMSQEERKEMFKHKVQLNFNKKNYMRGMSETEYTLSLIAEYFSQGVKDKKRSLAWYRVPMLSNKPSSEFILAPRYTGMNYKNSIVSGFKMIFNQEIQRIITVQARAKDESIVKINNFDKNGSKFCFLDFLNNYLTGSQKDSELGQFIQKKISGQELTFQEKQRLDALLSEVITQFMDQKADQVIAQWEQDGITDGLKKLDGFTDNVQSNRERLREFIWNDTFASMNIMQLTITDIAYYKDAEDLQKRLAQIHAPGVRGNIYVRDYNGHEVTDGTHRTFYLTDFDDFKSNIIENVREVFYRKLQVLANRLGEGYQNNSEYLAAKATYDSIIDQFNAINVADAQAYSSPTSYRKKALMFGKWDAAKEEAYQRLINGDYSVRELQTVFGQPLKPFLYSNTTKDSGVLDAPMTQLKVPVQNKNSEYLLIMADAILQNEETGRPNLLRAIFQVMEESHRGTYDENGNYVPATDGIDTVQFESTVKSGLAGKIDIKQFQDVENGERLAKEEIERHIYSQWQDVENPDGTITRTHTREYNKNHIHETPYEDYCLQQEVPEHFIEHSQAHGSQIRYIIPSDLDTVDDSGNQVYYTFNDPKLGQRRLTAQEFKEEYERTISENIQESINELSKELCIGEYYTSTKERNIAISKILKREIQSSPRYGIDLLMACEVDENGNFKIPLGDPIQSKRIEQLLNSIIKNRINKQKIAGGPVVQVTNFGTSQELQIRFKDKNGGMLLTHKEWDALETKQHDTYQDYIKENQGGIAYYEVFAPAYTRDLFKYFTDENGNIDIEAIEKTNPDLLKMVGYRIPTEDKYSMFPAKIVGFLPPEAGDGVMLPNDITLLTGSDFDVDKMYLMVKEFDFGRKPMKEIRQYLKDKLLSSLKGEERDKMNEEINSFLDQIVDMSSDEMVQQAKQNYPEIYKVYKQFAYQAVEPTEGRLYRNNKIVDMSYAVLTEETTADKMLNPGGFEQQKRMGYMVAAYKKPEVRKKYSWEDLEKLTTDELKKLCFVNKNLSFIDTHIQFYKQNSAAGMILGMFAVQKIAHAALESDGIILNLNGVKDFEKFTLCGKRFSDYIELDERYDTRGQFVGKTLGSLVASAADAVKDPVLNLMNINSNTASLLTTMIRFGMPFEDAALFISQNTVTELLHEFNKRQISGEFIRMNDLVQQRIDALEERYSFDGSTQINQEELTREELINGLRDDLSQEERDKIDYKVLKVYKSLALVANEIKGTTFATRLNSVSNAVGPLVVDNLILERKFDTFSQNMYIRRGDRIEELSLGEIFRMHPILGSFSDGVFIAKDILRDMPANSQNFRNILSVMMDENLGYDAIGKIIYNDRKLLGMLSDFYQSYMLVASGFADESQLAYYVSQFPSEVIKSDLKEKYKGNPFVDSMKYDTTKLPDGRLIPVLKIDITGLDTSQKEVLSSGWTDLYKQDPEIATKLFLYNFFRTGIGFSPKTFTSLTSTYIKSRLENNGVKYTSIFDGSVEINPMVVLKQFILNNLDNNKLCQKIELEKGELFQEGTVIYITGPKRIAEVGNKPFIKVTTQNGTRYYEKIDEDDNQVTFQEIKPLGGDGAYFEVSNDEITQPLIESQELHENEEIGQEVSGDQHKTNEEESFDVLQDAISKKNYTFAALTVIMETRNYTQEQAQSALVQSKQKQKNKESLLNAIKKVFDKHQVFYSESEVESVYKEFC